ncbi:MAG: c-type cytochrome [Vicinamibacteria bacterium]
MQIASRIHRSAALVALLVVAAPRGAHSQPAPQPKPASEPTAAEAPAAITPPAGPSWLVRRNLVMLDASLGRIGNVAVPATAAGPQGAVWPWLALREHWTLTGADLYRLNCRSCHNALGSGLPPEINSLLDPMRATSSALLKKRMEERGRSLDAQTAREMASQADGNIRKRLHDGGEKMPALPHLSPAEVDAILGHVGRLAGLPEAERKDPRLTLSTAQVGQHVVKGTCQICHDTSGPGTYSGRNGTGKLIPSLTVIVETKSMPDMIRKVHTGSPSAESRGEMPLFPYLSDEELGAAYVYLVSHPPQATASR